VDIRVVRGGSWNGHARSCRAAHRDGRAPANRIGDVVSRAAFRLD
jgi:formylglycine-generating enzyme required for sulfatase activity